MGSLTSKFVLEDLAFPLDLITAGTLRPAIDRTYPLSEAREAVRYVATRRPPMQHGGRFRRAAGE